MSEHAEHHVAGDHAPAGGGSWKRCVGLVLLLCLASEFCLGEGDKLRIVVVAAMRRHQK